MVAGPPTTASRVPASTGASGMVDQPANWVTDCTRPMRASGVTAIR